MKRLAILLLLISNPVLAQSVPSPEFGSDVDISLLFKDYGAQSNVVINPRDARVNMAVTGRVVATWSVALPIPNWAGLFSPTNQSAAAIRQAARREVVNLRSIRTNLAVCIDNVSANIDQIQAVPALSATFTAAENRATVNTLRKELIDQSQELKAALQQVQELRRYLSDQTRD